MTLSSSTLPDNAASAPSVLWKAFSVLNALSDGRRVMTLNEVARRSGNPKSTTHRILAMLLEVRAVERDGHGYRIGLQMFTMGTSSAEVQLRNTALPYLERLRRITGQTVHLAVMQDDDVVYLEKLPGLASPPTPAIVGGRLPASSTGVGKALLAFGNQGRPPAHPDGFTSYLQSVRQSGVASDREGTVRGLACVAAPVLVASRPVAAVSVAFTSSAGSGEVFVNALREAVTGVSRAVAAVSVGFR